MVGLLTYLTAALPHIATQYAFRQPWGRLKTKTSYTKATIIEVGNLVNLPDNYQKNVLTSNRMDVGEVDEVKVVHVVDWLVGGGNNLITLLKCNSTTSIYA